MGGGWPSIGKGSQLETESLSSRASPLPHLTLFPCKKPIKCGSGGAAIRLAREGHTAEVT